MKRCPDRSDDRGSMLIALMLMLILAGAGTLLLVSTVADNKTTQHDQQFTDVLPAANAAIMQGLFMLNHGAVASLPACSATGQPPANGFVQGSQSANWCGKPVTSATAPTSYLLTAASNGLKRNLTAEAYQSSRFSVAAFAEKSVVFRGGNAATSYNSASGSTATTGHGVIGSDGSVTIDGNATADGVNLWNWTADPNTARCSGTPCTAPGYTTTGSYYDISSPTATQFISAQLAACTSSPAYTTTAAATLPAGTWCASSLSFGGDITLTGPTTIYVSGNVFIDHHLNINYAAGVVPVPANLQIYMLGSSFDMSNHTTIAAAIYAPKATCNGGAQSVVYGSLTCGSISNVGGWQFHYDDALATIGLGDFRLRHFRESPIS